MIKIENTDVYGWEAAIRGMRNPMNSWGRSDSHWEEAYGVGLTYKIGQNDLDLMHRLYEGGSVHSKYLRMITVTVDITAPLYWWKEFDTYKVGTVANSCSTMHKIHSKEFTIDDFSHEHLSWPTDLEENERKALFSPVTTLSIVIGTLNSFRDLYNLTAKRLKDDKTLTESERKHLTAKQKKFWWQMIQLLPSSYNQKRTVQLNYEVIMGIYKWRKNHKLDEWHAFCAWIEELPYFKEIRGGIE